MKNLILILLLALTSCASYHTISYDQPVVDQFEAQGSRAELFVKANEWMVDRFISSKSVIEFSDKETGTIIGKYVMFDNIRPVPGYSMSVGHEIKAKVDVRVKDGAAKIEIKPLESWKYDSNGVTIYTFSKEDADRLINDMVSSFRSHMTKTGDAWN